MKNLIPGFLILFCYYSFGFNYKFKKITVADGLSTRWVKCFYRDKEGFLWIGTPDGLNKYNGVSVKVYKFSTSDSNTISHNYINAIFEDKKGRIWIGTQNGLNRYIKEKDCFYREKKILGYISCFNEVDNGFLLIGGSYGIYVYDPDIKKLIKRIELPGTEVFLKDFKNLIWVGTRLGLYKLNLLNFKIEKFDFLKNVSVRSLLLDDKNRIWVGTENDGLFIIEKSDSSDKYNIRNIRSNYKNFISLSEATIYALEKDNYGNIWVGIENGGINIFTSKYIDERVSEIIKIYQDFSNPYSISDNSIHAIYRDKQDIIWIGTYGGGISYTHPIIQRFQHVFSCPFKFNSLLNNYINAIYDEENYTYIGTEKGLSIYDKINKVFINYVYDKNNPLSIRSNSVWTIYRDSKKNLWIGTWKGGLNLFDEKTKTFKKFFPDNSIAEKYFNSDCITKVIETDDGILWIATLGGGLYSYDFNKKKFIRYNQGNGLSCNWIYDIVEDNHRNIWIASTEAVDVFFRKQNKFVKFVNDNIPGSISYNGAMALFKDSKGNIWICTSNGLNVYDFKVNRFKCYTTYDGLPDNSIKAIIEDDSNNLWISTGRGISKFIKGIYKPDNPEFINFDVNDGLQENEFNPRAVFKNKNGYIFFGGANGYNIFHPDSIKEYDYIPEVALTYITLSSKNKDNGKENEIKLNLCGMDEIKIKRKYSIIKIEFASLDLISPIKNQYAYYLEGFEKSWKYVKNQNFATYTNLNPGKYIFKVKGTNCDGKWNNVEKSLKIVILPAWYETILARIIYLVFIVFIVYILLRLRYKLWLEHQEKIKIEELGKLKLQFFTNISHEIRTPLTLIIAPLKELIEKDEISEKIRYAYRNAIRLKALVDQILDFNKFESQMMKVHLTKKEITSFITNILINFTDFALNKNIDLSYRSTFKKLVAKIDEDKIEKVIINIVINALKYTSNNGKIEIYTHYDNNNKELLIEISDTGRGIAPEDIKHIFERFFTSINVALTGQGSGIGLNLTHKLIELMNGKIVVDSKIGKGTKFKITVPVECVEIIEGNFYKSLTTKDLTKVKLKNSHLKKENRRYNHSILIIDDNEELCNYLGDVLSEHFDVFIVNSAIEAYHKLQEIMPDVIILDIMMPEINGFEFCHKIKNDIRYCHIPVIILTARDNIKDQIKGYEEGADDYILKPFEVDLLLARIKNLLRRKENIRKELIGIDGVINKNTSINSLDIEFIEKVIKIVQENYTNPDFNVNNIIEKIGLSRSVFYKKFKSLSNQSIHDLINEYRLKKARELLLTTNLNINEVAAECGFDDPAYFSKVFKKKYGISPKEFKNNNN